MLTKRLKRTRFCSIIEKFWTTNRYDGDASRLSDSDQPAILCPTSLHQVLKRPVMINHFSENSWLYSQSITEKCIPEELAYFCRIPFPQRRLASDISRVGIRCDFDSKNESCLVTATTRVALIYVKSGVRLKKFAYNNGQKGKTF